MEKHSTPGSLLAWLSIATAVPSIGYSSVLVARLLNGGTGRLGLDVIQLAYFFAISASALGLAAASRDWRFKKLPSLTRIAITLGIVASLFWISLQLSGRIYSHESVFR